MGIHTIRFGDGVNSIVAAHGITASGMSFARVARHLPADWSMFALDLRGRGHSSDLSGPFGMDRHAADICEFVEGQGRQVVLTGQSMGAYAALRAAATRPELFSHVVLIDGGLPLPVPEGADPDELLRVTIGPAIARLSQTFPTRESYVDFFRAHPALSAEWNDDVEAYVLYDTVGEPPEVRSRVNPEAVRDDGRDLVVGAAGFGEDLLKLQVPVTLLHAPNGMLGQPPGMLPQPLVDYWKAKAPALKTELIEGSNHYTILMADGPAAIIAKRLTEQQWVQHG